jgi:hypothetical protein
VTSLPTRPLLALLTLLALPLLLGAVTVCAWWMGDSAAARVANADLMAKFAGPLCATLSTLSILKTGSDRALVLPTPIMLWLVATSARSSGSVPAFVVAQLAVVMLLLACWHQRRRPAQWAATCCGASAIWLQLSAPSG